MIFLYPRCLIKVPRESFWFPRKEKRCMNLSHITEQGLVKLVFLILLPLCWFLGDQTENYVLLAFLVLKLRHLLHWVMGKA